LSPLPQIDAVDREFSVFLIFSSQFVTFWKIKNCSIFIELLRARARAGRTSAEQKKNKNN